MRGCWVASQYGPHLLVPLARLGHIEKQPSILACQLIFFIIYTSRVPLGYIFAIYVHPSVDIQQCISNTYNFKHLNLKKKNFTIDLCFSNYSPQYNEIASQIYPLALITGYQVQRREPPSSVPGNQFSGTPAYIHTALSLAPTN